MTNPDTERQIEELLRQPYHKVVYGDPKEGYLGKVIQLPGCVTAGATELEALENLKEAMAAWFESNIERGLPIPQPADQFEAAD